MRWTNPKLGEQRMIRKFLFFPRRIENETRWLEWASIRQRREIDMTWYLFICEMWCDLRWEA